VTLKEAAPGSLYGIDKLAFMIDQNLNEFVTYLVSLVESQPEINKLAITAARLIL
jgi:hypothetical protein